VEIKPLQIFVFYIIIESISSMHPSRGKFLLDFVFYIINEVINLFNNNPSMLFVTADLTTLDKPG